MDRRRLLRRTTGKMKRSSVHGSMVRDSNALIVVSNSLPALEENGNELEAKNAVRNSMLGSAFDGHLSWMQPRSVQCR